jgi:serine/threonine protein kinase
MPDGDLDGWLHHHRFEPQDVALRRRLTVSQRVDIGLDIVGALNYVHHHGQTPLVHCDLKPSNVFLDGNMVTHMVDLDLAP